MPLQAPVVQATFVQAVPSVLLQKMVSQALCVLLEATALQASPLRHPAQLAPGHPSTALAASACLTVCFALLASTVPTLAKLRSLSSVPLASFVQQAVAFSALLRTVQLVISVQLGQLSQYLVSQAPISQAPDRPRACPVRPGWFAVQAGCRRPLHAHKGMLALEVL